MKRSDFQSLADLVIATPEVRTEGPKKVYEKIRSLVSTIRARNPLVPLEEISVVDPNSPIIKVLKSGLRTWPGSGGVRFSRNVVNGVLVEDAYIYKLS